MLGDKDAIVTVAVKDIDVAKKFYEGTLGLHPSSDQEPGTLAYQTAKSTIFVYPSQYAGTNQATAVTWFVDDVEGLVKALAAKGVKFEHYDNLPDTKVVGDLHIAGDKKLAWFKDPDGNIHALAG
ncbi:MAG TPA: VOC family protein [Thermoanaerobaculia bacterium]|jgi:catechol 2,3-dioxygenase-like lactoylglutathione lyase family enzyme|nr:VOC family protein [Thermoanaerobaculia bacterium]